MAERPILFSGEMVRAILEGRKTQTRRVIKPKPPLWCTGIETVGDPAGFRLLPHSLSMDDSFYGWRRCPYGQPGDRLWVRETWMPFTENGCPIGEAIYRATDKPEPDGDYPLKWRPSIFMPRWASRITLEIVSVRVQRVNNICFKNTPLNADFIAEGIKPISWVGNQRLDDYKTPFIKLWDSINAKRGYSWESNPWVWAIEFKVVENGG
jgi:hypothetical protein